MKQKYIYILPWYVFFRYPSVYNRRKANEGHKRDYPEYLDSKDKRVNVLPCSWDDRDISRLKTKSWKDKYKARYQWQKNLD